MTQIVIDNVVALTTPKQMMAAIDDNFDELYAADTTNLATAVSRANHTGTQLASTISDLGVVVESLVAASAAVAANTAKVSNVTTNLSYTLTPSSVTVVSSDGLDAVIPAADTTLAGVMSAAYVNAIAANTAKVSNVTTDLTFSQTSTTVTVASSDGADAVLPAATSSLAGVMSAAQAAAVTANTAKVSNVTTNLTFSQTGTTLTVLSSDGSDAVLPAATATLAGVMSAAQVTKLNTASASYTAPWI